MLSKASSVLPLKQCKENSRYEVKKKCISGVRYDQEGKPLRRSLLGRETLYNEKKLLHEAKSNLTKEIAKLMMKHKNAKYREKMQAKRQQML